MKRIFSLYLLVILLYGCNEPKSTPIKDPGFNDKKLEAEIAQQEIDEPKQFLHIDSSTVIQNKVRDPGIFTTARYNGWKISGSLTNEARKTAYDQVTLAVRFRDKYDMVIENIPQEIEGTIKPRDSKTFEFVIDAPKGSDNYLLSVKSARPLK